MTHRSTSFRSLLREKHTHDLLALAPKETQMALLSIQENDQLNQFYASGENVGLRRERCRALTTLADLNAVITRVKWSLICMSRDARRLATVGRWLARSVRRIQQFVRERLAILREKKRALLVMWQSHQRQSKQNLEKVAKDTGLRLRSSQHTVFDQEDLWGLVIDCNIDEESMKEAIESVWHVRKAQYSRVFRETQSERKGQLMNKLNRMSDQQEVVDEVLKETAQPAILLDADSPAGEDNLVEALTPTAVGSPSTPSTPPPPPLAADTTFGDFRHLALTPLQQKDLQPSDDPKSRWTLWRGAHAAAAKVSHLPNHPRKSLVIRTMTFRKLRLKRLQFEVPNLKFGVEHVTMAELCAHHKILQIRNVSKNIEQYWIEKQRLNEGMAQAAAIVASVHHEAVAHHDRNAQKAKQADAKEHQRRSSNFLDVTTGSLKLKLLSFRDLAATASAEVSALPSPNIDTAIQATGSVLPQQNSSPPMGGDDEEIHPHGDDQQIRAAEGEASTDRRQSSTKSFSASAAEASQDGHDDGAVEKPPSESSSVGTAENDERAVQRSREAGRCYTLSDDEEMALEGLMEPAKHSIPVSYLHALFTLEAKSHWFTLLCLKRLQHGQLDVTPPIGSHATMFEQADEAVRTFKRWGRQLLQPKGESRAPTIDPSGQPFPRCGITPVTGRRSPPISPRRMAPPPPLSVPMLSTVATLTATGSSSIRQPQPPILSTKARAAQQMGQWLQTLRLKTGKETEAPKGEEEENDEKKLWNAVMEVHKQRLCHAKEHIRHEQQKQLELIHRQHKTAVLGTQAILQRNHELPARASSLTPKHQKSTQSGRTKDFPTVANAVASVGSLSPTQLLTAVGGVGLESGGVVRPQSARVPHRPDPLLASAVATRRVMGITLTERCQSSKSPTPLCPRRQKSPQRKPPIPLTSRKRKCDGPGAQASQAAATEGPSAAATNVPQPW